MSGVPVLCVLVCGRVPLRMSLCAVCRFVVGLGSLTALCLAFPACSSSLAALLAITAAVGVAYSIAFGTSHQLVPRFTQRSTVALNTGVWVRGLSSKRRTGLRWLDLVGLGGWDGAGMGACCERLIAYCTGHVCLTHRACPHTPPLPSPPLH